MKIGIVGLLGKGIARLSLEFQEHEIEKVEHERLVSGRAIASKYGLLVLNVRFMSHKHTAGMRAPNIVNCYGSVTRVAETIREFIKERVGA